MRLINSPFCGGGNAGREPGLDGLTAKGLPGWDPASVPGYVVPGRPCPALRDYVLGYVGFPPGARRPCLRRVLPSGIVPLLLEFSPGPVPVIAGGSGVRLPGQPVFGLHERAILIEPRPASGIAVVLTPPGAHALFGIALREIAGTVTGAADLLGSQVQPLTERLAAIPAWPARFALLDQVLRAWLARHQEPAPVIIRAWRRLHESAGQLRIDSLAAEMGTSRRYLERQFSVQVGLSPKAVARVIRFQAAARLVVTAAGRDLAAVARAAGYSDHAHLDREFKTISGCTPSQFRAEQALARARFSGSRLVPRAVSAESGWDGGIASIRSG